MHLVIINKQQQPLRLLIMVMEHHQHLISVQRPMAHLHTVFHLREILFIQQQHPMVQQLVHNNNEEQPPPLPPAKQPLVRIR